MLGSAVPPPFSPGRFQRDTGGIVRPVLKRVLRRQHRMTQAGSTGYPRRLIWVARWSGTEFVQTWTVPCHAPASTSDGNLRQLAPDRPQLQQTDRRIKAGPSPFTGSPDRLPRIRNVFPPSQPSHSKTRLRWSHLPRVFKNSIIFLSFYNSLLDLVYNTFQVRFVFLKCSHSPHLFQCLE